MSMILPTQAYELKLAPHPAPFSILKFTGLDRVSQLYRYEIEFTSPVAGIPMDQVLGRPAKFVADPVDPDMDYLRKMFGENAARFSTKPAAYTVHGVITQFDELETSADETRYRVVLEPTLADLDRGVTSRLFQKQSVEEIVTDTLRHYGYRAGVDFQFQLRGQYKRREYVTQYHETTFAFIRRMCAEEGIWFRWEQKKDRAVVVFGDDLDAYARKQRTVPYRRDSGLESVGADAIKTLGREMKRVPEAVRLHDYNHRQAGVSLLVEENTARDDKTTNAVDYRWGEHYETPEEGKRVARLRHEAYLAGQITFRGTGNPFWLEAGEVMRVEPKPADAKHGVFVTSVESHGGRNESYWVAFEGIPSDRVWRTSMASISRPVVDGILPARITSPGNYKYAYLTEQGWYVIKLPFDLDEWSPGGTSRPVRLAKPYSGGDYGHHFPLIDGAEVAIVHTDGDPNRPVIIGAMHDSVHPDLVNNLNHTRNLIRTAARNELRMEDREGNEHVHLITPFRASQLNLGFMVDIDRNARGTGAELATDGHASIRAADGVLVSAEAQPGAAGEQLAMHNADATFAQAEEILRSLNDAANAAKALQAEANQQRVLIEQKLSRLQKPVIVASAPEGVGIASGQHVQVAARKQMFITAGEGLDIGVMKRITAAAGEAISFFAARLGIRLFAAKGKVQIQAQGDGMELMAMQDVHVCSSDGGITITGRKSVTIGDGSGAYIKLSGGKIVLGSPAGEIELKGDLTVNDADGGSFKFPTWSSVPPKDVKNTLNFGFSE
ncbi:type VI secretion system tip protein VgrG [Burkholderia semiarida]|uniref:type VI secretion system Vgr family protein n=1 Tax=Burkholderia TaxID=32008 RepID=UPI00265F5F70|nr:type VI secretion system Vgr family protein [Burkholderia sp. AU44665]MDN7701593.1 type VI secretion system tip protein VgrG [Burkholderia sp. AU44665]